MAEDFGAQNNMEDEANQEYLEQAKAAMAEVEDPFDIYKNQSDQVYVQEQVTPEDLGWEPADGRDISALQNPRPTIIVSARGMRKHTGFATIAWAMPVSHDPAMVAISLRERSHTFSVIQQSGCFVLNILPATEQAANLAQVIGTRSGRNINKVPLVKHHLMPIDYDAERMRLVETKKAGLFRKAQYEEVTKTVHEENLVPVVDCASSWIACAVDRIEPAGDHMLIIGTVVEAWTKADRDSSGQAEPTDVLLCMQRESFGKVTPLGADAPAPKPAAPAKMPPAPPRA